MRKLSNARKLVKASFETLEKRELLSSTVFTIDPALSSLTLQGNVIGYDLSQQGPGSLTDKYTGTISAAVTGNSIQFDGNSAVTAENSGDWQPDGTPANYAGQANLLFASAYAAVRNLVMNVKSPAIPIVSGKFVNNPATVSVTQGEIDYSDPINGADSDDMTGSSASNTAGTSSYAVSNGVATLTIGVNVTLTETLFETNDSDLNIFGTIVATAKVTTPPPPVLGSISGTVFGDTNGNGIKDPTDKGLTGWKLFLDTNKNGKFDTGETEVTTDSNGNFTFPNLAAGTYRVAEVLQTGYQLTTPIAKYKDVTLSAGQKVTGVLFGDEVIPPTGAISGSVFNDANGNGVKDSTEKGLANWKVFIDTNKNGKFDTGEKEVTTDASGAFAFSGLAAGTYQVTEILDAGYRATKPTVNYSDVTLTTGQKVTGLLFLDTTEALITGTIFNDANANGKQDSTEKGLANWKVYIDKNKDGKLDNGETAITTTSTGAFTLPPLAAGTYRVAEVLNSGYRVTNPSVTYTTITVTSGEILSTLRFGNTTNILISGTVFKDINGNGKQDTGDLGLSGWSVYIDLKKTGTLATGDPVTTTDSKGNFSFATLPAGTYLVRIVPKTGFTRTTPTAGFFTVTLTSGQVKTGLLFGEKA